MKFGNIVERIVVGALKKVVGYDESLDGILDESLGALVVSAFVEIAVAAERPVVSDVDVGTVFEVEAVVGLVCPGYGDITAVLGASLVAIIVELYLLVGLGGTDKEPVDAENGSEDLYDERVGGLYGVGEIYDC